VIEEADLKLQLSGPGSEAIPQAAANQSRLPDRVMATSHKYGL